MSIGGRTAWYCPECGELLREGRTCSCGAAGVPSNQPIAVEGKGGRLGEALRGLVARLAGRGGATR